ncbi:MAG: GNAT family N-acetyltransferase [Wenzhouxiangella sp.]
MDKSEISWNVALYEQLERDQLYDMLAARAAVFVVEQNCPYQDLDGLDRHGIHVRAVDAGGQVLAYARILGPGRRFEEPSIGRVLTTATGRGRRLGRELMQRALAEAERRFPGQAVRISAQQYLEKFYIQLGFTVVRGPYLEDDIPHLEMLRPADSK